MVPPDRHHTLRCQPWDLRVVEHARDISPNDVLRVVRDRVAAFTDYPPADSMRGANLQLPSVAERAQVCRVQYVLWRSIRFLPSFHPDLIRELDNLDVSPHEAAEAPAKVDRAALDEVT